MRNLINCNTTHKYIAYVILTILIFSLNSCELITIDELLQIIDNEIFLSNPDITVIMDTTALTDNAWEYDFNEVIVDGPGGYGIRSITITLINDGDAESVLTIESVAVSGDSTDFNHDFNGRIELKYTEEIEFSIHFDPLSGGDKSGTIAITSDDPDENPFTFIVNGTGMEFTYEMVTVHGGTNFSMGYDMDGTQNNEVSEPVHTIPSISSFNMGTCEITYELWGVIKNWAENNGYTFANNGVMGSDGSGIDQEPVTSINWRDCIVFSNAFSELIGFTPCYYTDSNQTTVYRDSTDDTVDISKPDNVNENTNTNACVNWNADGYRLPTEAEWEYAARYIDGSSFDPGNSYSGCYVDPDVLNCAWYLPNSSGKTYPVGKKTPNSLGIYDLSGNVLEWCWNWYSYYGVGYSLLDPDPKGPDIQDNFLRIIRGGCCVLDFPSLRTSERSNFPPTQINSYLGFRLVRRP